MDRKKFKRMSLNEMATPDISVTPTKDGKYNLFSEKSGITIGTFSKRYLLERGVFSEYQLNNIKGTTNFRALNKPKRNKDNILEKVPMKKIPVKKIILHWYEGKQVPGVPEDAVFKSIPEMNRFLRSQSLKAPKTGGYDKYKITVVWEDGQDYTGRWDVTNPLYEHHSKDDVLIGYHIKNWLKYRLENDDLSLNEKKEISEFLNKYDLDD